MPWYTPSCWGLSSVKGCSNGSARFGMSKENVKRKCQKKIPEFCIVYERLLHDEYGVMDGYCRTDSKSTM